MIHSIYGFEVPTFQARRLDTTPAVSTSPSSTQTSTKPALSNMRALFRNRRANSESGDTRRPGPEDAGPSRADSRPAPIQEDSTEGRESRSPPIDIPGQTAPIDIHPPPNYTSQLSNAPIPSYELALSQSPTGTTPRMLGLSLAQSPPARSGFLDYRISASNGGSESTAGRSSGSRGCAIAEDDDTDEDDPLVPRFIRPTPALNLIPLPHRRATFGGSDRRPPSPSSSDAPMPLILPVELPPPPANALPAYSPHLLRDELRLISAVHLDRTHPAAAFFNNLATNFTTPGGTQRVQTTEMSTGGKKLKVTLTKGAERMSSNGVGPMFIRLPRGGEISGRVEVGKVDHATRLEIAIIGLVNTSYYIRGQYTLIDTLPLCRRMQVLYPPSAPEGDEAGQDESTVTISADGVERHTGPSTEASTSNANGTPTQNGTTPAVLDNAEIGAAPPSQPVGKDGIPFIPQGQKFEFALKMPNHHYRESNIELPPTASIFQVGMQAGVEYVLRIKMSRKGWRLNETITIPIIYEPRAYVSPRRLRALTTDDAMNPGWRTIKLHGGDPNKPVNQPAQPAEGVDVTLLLPSPPIVYVPWGGQAPPIPFHLHFHSSLTHALSTFSDPSQCQFVIRLMRVATMRIGTEREIRRMEVPAKVEIWQEGGPKIVIHDPAATANGSGLASQPVSAATNQPSATTTASGSGISSSPAATTGTSGRRPSATTGGETRRQSFLRRLSIGSESRESALQRQNSNVPPVTPVAPVAELPEPSTIGSSDSPASTTSQSPTTATSTIASTPLAPIADEEDPTAPVGTVSSTESPLAPLSLSSTDVHFLGQLTISYPPTGPELLRRLVQSFMTPEIGITYVLEVGLQPHAGSVKEAFKHVWGGGMVEIVLGARPEVDPAVAP